MQPCSKLAKQAECQWKVASRLYYYYYTRLNLKKGRLKVSRPFDKCTAHPDIFFYFIFFKPCCSLWPSHSVCTFARWRGGGNEATVRKWKCRACPDRAVFKKVTRRLFPPSFPDKWCQPPALHWPPGCTSVRRGLCEVEKSRSKREYNSCGIWVSLSCCCIGSKKHANA